MAYGSDQQLRSATTAASVTDYSFSPNGERTRGVEADGASSRWRTIRRAANMDRWPGQIAGLDVIRFVARWHACGHERIRLRPDSTVYFGSAAAASVTVLSANSIRAVSPPGSGAVDVKVSTPVGTSLANDATGFSYKQPSITKLSPTSGTNAGGTSITIEGLNLAGVTDLIGGKAATFTASATKIIAKTPAGTGTVTVGLTTGQGTATATQKFTYLSRPEVRELRPPTGPKGGGTTVT